jgi:hypothetical protein
MYRNTQIQENSRCVIVNGISENKKSVITHLQAKKDVVRSSHLSEVSNGLTRGS